MIVNVIALVALISVGAAVTYQLLIAVASVFSRDEAQQPAGGERTRFAIVIAAHDEAAVIARSIRQIHRMDYPSDRVEVHVVADHCTDDTAAKALEARAEIHVRDEGPRTGKGAALSWLFATWLARSDVDAVVVFDADSIVHPGFLTAMDRRLRQGATVIQGQHVISNPSAGWFAAMTSAMFLVDNRFQNLGRANLGLSAKNMGDAICIGTNVLRRYGWGRGLAEDYEMRHRLLLDGVNIQYEPSALSYGEAPASLSEAMAQRTRWLAGAQEASSTYRWRLLRAARMRRTPALIDGALQAWLPSYSTTSLIAVLALLLLLIVHTTTGIQISRGVVAGWGIVVGLLALYPLFGLALERAQAKAYLAILMGPAFILWRALIVMRIRLLGKPEDWERTAHGVGN